MEEEMLLEHVSKLLQCIFTSSSVAGIVPTIVLWNCHATLGMVCRQKIHLGSVGSKKETKGQRGGEDGKNVKVLSFKKIDIKIQIYFELHNPKF